MHNELIGNFIRVMPLNLGIPSNVVRNAVALSCESVVVNIEGSSMSTEYLGESCPDDSCASNYMKHIFYSRLLRFRLDCF